jgi:uncharacterized protein (DUF1800 family)
MLRYVKARFKTGFLMLALLLLSACGGGGSSDTPAPPTPPPEPPPPPVEVTAAHRIDAARLLTQATYGPLATNNEDTAYEIANNGHKAWISSQINKPQSLHYPLAVEALSMFPNDDNQVRRIHRLQAWWHASVFGEDQLRQRMAFALTQLFVVSEKSQLSNFQLALANYYDIHVREAFGNYRDILEEITKSPVMGLYLSMLGNEKPQPALNIRPDENFARELMQLFTIGLVELNRDGTVKLDQQGQAIPTYDQAIIEAYAHVFTGWHFNGTTVQTWDQIRRNLNFIEPMTLVDAYHDPGEKVLLGSTIVPPGTDGEVALDMALDSLFNHPNLAPFVARHFIQRFVTSNPSPDYIERVAMAFEDNGEGVRGDMLALITAVLADDEARSESAYSQTQFGKVKEPIIRAANIVRALLPTNDNTEENLSFYEFANIDYFTNQAPLSSPSVFNFYSPDYQVNGELSELGMVTPEMQILTANYLVRNHNFAAYYLYTENLRTRENHVYADYFPFAETLANDQPALYEQFSLLIMQGDMDDQFAQVIQDYDEQVAPFVDEAARAREMLFLMLTSPQFAIQR